MSAAADYWVLPDWHAPAAVRALTTTRFAPGLSTPPHHRFNLGTRAGEDPAVTTANRQLLLQHAGLPSEPVWLDQVHGTAVHVADASIRSIDGARDPVADAAVTRTPGVVLVVLTADCLPLLLAVADGSEVAAVHAGWRGLAAGVVEAALGCVRAPRSRVHAWLGPAIGPDAYEVGDEVRAAFVAADAGAAGAFRPTRPGHSLCDLYALTRRRLAAAGVEQVHGGSHCTWRERERFYSYRRDGMTGRMASLIWIEPRP